MTRFRKNARDLESSNTQNIVNEEQSSNKISARKNGRGRFTSIFKGLLLSLLSGLTYSSCSVLVKSMKNISPGQLAIYRFIAASAFSLPEAVKTQENLFAPRELRALLLVRGILGATQVFFNFLAVRYLPLGEASVILFSFPVFVTAASRIFLKESCGIVQSVAAVISIVGMIFITRIPEAISGESIGFTKEYIYGVAAAFASLMFNTGQIILLRKLKRIHYSVIQLNFGLVGILETAILTVFTGDFSLHKCGLQQCLLVLLGIVSYTATVLFTLSLQLEQAGPVSTMRAASEIISSFLWQTFLFHDAPDAYSITGAVLMGFSVTVLSLIKWVSSLPSESSAAKYLKILLSKIILPTQRSDTEL